ncbi:unnamed protein product [Nippostrongylus brasiliensis]|uniref:Resolvase/invertase-type recombinase catalytic domain-containing protein n=1 Tax=Nippostrongylus brasiliensis TaxID=27835 RepID=A0A0N4YGC0_NIPBR|nr:unnamed protein product [Nippostrongylus brasiliensis]
MIEGVRAGRTTVEIIRFFRISRLTVYDVVARTAEAVEQAQELILEDPGQSLRNLATMLGEDQMSSNKTAQQLIRAIWWKTGCPITWTCSGLGVVERVANETMHPNPTSLRTAIGEFANLDRGFLKRTCERFRSRMEEIIAADGSYIEPL